MAWKEALGLAQLQQAERQTSVIEGHKILFIWHEEQVHAVQSQCPHLKLPLAKGKITEEGELVCPFHKSSFDLITGKVKCWSPWPAGIGALLGKISSPKELCVYRTKVENDQIFIDI
jgi:nitrite reductase/ring-hydroxylating ferredoxin subunit